jgi:cadmium resistance protein CadD (predicted permease)
MDSPLSLAGVAIAAFASTNLDDLVILIALFTDVRLTSTSIVAGQLAGMAALIAISAAGAVIAVALPGVWVGVLGLLPIGIGGRQLWRLRRAGAQTGAAAVPDRGAMPIALAVIASGGDNISLYIPLFAAHSRPEVALLAGAFMGLSLIWCWIARVLSRSHDRAAQRWLEAQGWSPAFVPLVLIALGIYVMAKAGALPWLVRGIAG